jgi:uncharacterized protein (DUF58 family)
MDAKEVIRKVRRIEIKTRRLSDHIFSGEYHSSFKGRGMTFSEVRPYQFGDDVRTIDWNVTARFQEPYVKVFEEERELTMMLLVDLSGSGNFGTRSMMKREMMTEICATLAFSALQNNDKVGLLGFTDQVELFIPPKKGKRHVLRIIRDLIEFEPQSQGTDIASAIKQFSNMIKRRSIAFLLSDFLDSGYEQDLKVAAKRHDITGIRIFDPIELKMNDLGILPVMDPESGLLHWMNSSSKKVRKRWAEYHSDREEEFQDSFKLSGSGTVSCPVDGSYVKELMSFFKRR